MDQSSWLRRFFDFFKPHRHLPHLPWTASHPWDVSIKRLLILVFGLAFFGLGDALIIVSSLGNAPWSVLAQGMAITLDISIGIATIFVGLTVLALWIPLKRKIGIGTLLNIVVISLFIDLGIYLFQKPSQILFQYLFLLLGIILVGLGSALYLTCGLGAGPRDGLMTGLNERTGVRIGRIRLTLEVVVLTLGAVLGGTVGVGTAIFALLIGQSVAIWLGVVSRST